MQDGDTVFVERIGIGAVLEQGFHHGCVEGEERGEQRVGVLHLQGRVGERGGFREHALHLGGVLALHGGVELRDARIGNLLAGSNEARQHVDGSIGGIFVNDVAEPGGGQLQADARGKLALPGRRTLRGQELQRGGGEVQHAARLRLPVASVVAVAGHDGERVVPLAHGVRRFLLHGVERLVRGAATLAEQQAQQVAVVQHGIALRLRHGGEGAQLGLRAVDRLHGALQLAAVGLLHGLGVVAAALAPHVEEDHALAADNADAVRLAGAQGEWFVLHHLQGFAEEGNGEPGVPLLQAVALHPILEVGDIAGGEVVGAHAKKAAGEQRELHPVGVLAEFGKMGVENLGLHRDGAILAEPAQVPGVVGRLERAGGASQFLRQGAILLHGGGGQVHRGGKLGLRLACGLLQAVRPIRVAVLAEERGAVEVGRGAPGRHIAVRAATEA